MKKEYSHPAPMPEDLFRLYDIENIDHAYFMAGNKGTGEPRRGRVKNSNFGLVFRLTQLTPRVIERDCLPRYTRKGLHNKDLLGRGV
jgi:hypothetical protein